MSRSSSLQSLVIQHALALAPVSERMLSMSAFRWLVEGLGAGLRCQTSYSTMSMSRSSRLREILCHHDSNLITMQHVWTIIPRMISSIHLHHMASLASLCISSGGLGGRRVAGNGSLGLRNQHIIWSPDSEFGPGCGGEGGSDL